MDLLRSLWRSPCDVTAGMNTVLHEVTMTYMSYIKNKYMNKSNFIVLEKSWFVECCRAQSVYQAWRDWGDTQDPTAHQDWLAYKDYQELQADQ